MDRSDRGPGRKDRSTGVRREPRPGQDDPGAARGGGQARGARRRSERLDHPRARPRDEQHRRQAGMSDQEQQQQGVPDEEYRALNKAIQVMDEKQPAAGGTTAWAPGMKPVDASRIKPIGVPFKPKRKPTRYEIQRRFTGVSAAESIMPMWQVMTVVTAASARTALRDWAERQDLATDELRVYLRA